jgi:hypothetical protein
MNIKDIDETRIINRPPAKARRPSNASETGASAKTRPNATSDEVDTSTLSQMMARSKVDLNLQLSVRPERVSSMRKFVDLPADLPDTVVNEVMRRLP